MDADKLQEWSEKFDSEYLQFDMIPESERLHPNRDICLLLKLYSILHAAHPRMISGAEHDVVYLADIDEIATMTIADWVYLQRCGVHFDSETESLAIFV